jgi:hypothetical protein
MPTHHELPVESEGRRSEDRRHRWGCIAGAVGTGAGGMVLFAGGLLALSGLSLRSCSFGLCHDPCLDQPTRLVEAASGGDRIRVIDLAGASLEERTDAAACALRFGHDDVAVALVERGADSNALVGAAAVAGYVGVIDAALANGADPQAVLDAIAGDVVPLGFGAERFGCDPLPGAPRHASDEEYQAMVRAATAAGADPNRSDGWTTPLLRSAYDGRTGAAKALLDAGSDPDEGGEVPAGLISMARSRLVEPGDPPHALPQEPGPQEIVADVTPLIGAATAGHSDIVEVLLAWGADPDVAAGNRFVALHAAAARNDRAMVDLLLAAGADPAPALDPGTPLPAETARRLGHTELADHLDRAAFVAALEPVPG